MAAAYDVAIVGAGIAGSALAVALSGAGLSVGLVEARPLRQQQLPAGGGVDGFDPRVSALTPNSVALLERLGAWQAVAEYRHCPYRHMTVWDADGTGRIEFDCGELRVPALGHIVENRVIVNSLLARLAESGDVHCIAPDSLAAIHRDADGGMRLRLASGAALDAGLVVGADGALSQVRQMLAFDTREWDYGHRAIVCTARTAESHRDTAWQRFLSSGPLAFLPLPGAPGEHYCSIVWSLQEALADELMALDDAVFAARLGEAFEGALGGIVGCSQRYAFPLRQRHAVDYVKPGVALVADAAHTIHPLAGQGINLGLQDVAVLAEELLAAHRRGLALGGADVLGRYQRRRKGENLLMMAAMDGFKRLFEREELPLRWLRNAGMRGVAQLPPLKQRLMRRAMGIG